MSISKLALREVVPILKKWRAAAPHLDIHVRGSHVTGTWAGFSWTSNPSKQDATKCFLEVDILVGKAGYFTQAEVEELNALFGLGDYKLLKRDYYELGNPVEMHYGYGYPAIKSGVFPENTQLELEVCYISSLEWVELSFLWNDLFSLEEIEMQKTVREVMRQTPEGAKPLAEAKRYFNQEGRWRHVEAVRKGMLPRPTVSRVLAIVDGAHQFPRPEMPKVLANWPKQPEPEWLGL